MCNLLEIEFNLWSFTTSRFFRLVFTLIHITLRNLTQGNSTLGKLTLEYVTLCNITLSLGFLEWHFL